MNQLNRGYGFPPNYVVNDMLASMSKPPQDKTPGDELRARKKPKVFHKTHVKKKAIQYAVKHGMEETAKKFNVSKKTIERYFHELAGMTYRAYMKANPDNLILNEQASIDEQKRVVLEAVKTTASKAIKTSEIYKDLSPTIVASWCKKYHGMGIKELRESYEHITS